MKRKRRLFVFILLGLIIVNYPYISQMINGISESRVVKKYDEELEQVDTERITAMLEQAHAYNDRIAQNQGGLGDAFTTGGTDEQYEKLLNLQNDGVMGYIEIPKIDIMLPIYHGVSATVLEKGAGHLYGSSLPVGGDNTHAVISSHRGLPSHLLFTDLDQLEYGDIFLITIASEILAYEVDDIRTVEPYETESLLVEEGKDYVTLVTCTPYGINSHRLLVRGERVPYEPEETVALDMKESQGMQYVQRMMLILSLIVLIVCGVVLLIPYRKDGNGKDGKR